MSPRQRTIKGMKEEATRLHSKIVRARDGHCLKCGVADPSRLTCSHIVKRKFSATRTDLDNGQALCWTCHRYFEDRPFEFYAFIDDTIGRSRFEELQRKANGGLIGLGMSPRQFWESEVERLRALWQEYEEAA